MQLTCLTVHLVCFLGLFCLSKWTLLLGRTCIQSIATSLPVQTYLRWAASIDNEYSCFWARWTSAPRVEAPKTLRFAPQTRALCSQYDEPRVLVGSPGDPFMPFLYTIYTIPLCSGWIGILVGIFPFAFLAEIHFNFRWMDNILH